MLALSIYDFGKQLLETEDLDPIYVMLHRADLPRVTLHRWLLAYWCFYHAGVASTMAEASDFHASMQQAQDERWPRGTERRHFRGDSSQRAITWLRENFPQPEAAVDSLADASTFREVARRVQRWPLFGPWISFKAADMLERVLAYRVSFEDCELGIYKDPAKAAEMLMPGTPLGKVIEHLVDHFNAYLAPPRYERPINVQEAETILCKWKSHCNGHYPVGKDTREIREGLDGWGELALRLRSALPQEKP